MSKRRDAAAPWRNRQPILDVLTRILPPTGLVLEIASGTGQHAAYFAPRLSPRRWQPSDLDPSMFDSIEAWAEETDPDGKGEARILPPLHLDASAAEWPIVRADAIIAINMIHIAPVAAYKGLLAGAARMLPAGGPLFLYGPFKRNGAHTAPTNRAFDESLRSRNPEWGVRDLDELAVEATAIGLDLDEVVEMPANNLSVVFRQSRTA